jgi:hypothetical protein
MLHEHRPDARFEKLGIVACVGEAARRRAERRQPTGDCERSYRHRAKLLRGTCGRNPIVHPFYTTIRDALVSSFNTLL